MPNQPPAFASERPSAPTSVAEMPLSETQKSRLFLYGPHEPLLFVGHYWRRGRPAPLRPNIRSAAAYAWSILSQ